MSPPSSLAVNKTSKAVDKFLTGKSIYDMFFNRPPAKLDFGTRITFASIPTNQRLVDTNYMGKVVVFTYQADGLGGPIGTLYPRGDVSMPRQVDLRENLDLMNSFERSNVPLDNVFQMTMTDSYIENIYEEN